MRKNLGMTIVSSKKQLGDYKVDSAFHPDEVVQINIRYSWGFSGQK